MPYLVLWWLSYILYVKNGSFFWAFFHSSLSPNVEFAAVWPPIAIHPVSRAIPLLGSCL
jgi:hypothetical protein